MADENTMRRLWRYKSDLEQELDEEKLIEILGKLKRLPVTISALQETGIGRVVNAYRKREGVVGDLARKVVGLWKAVVETEVKTSRRRSPSQSPRNAGSDAEAEDSEHAEAEDPEHAEVEDPEHSEVEDPEHAEVEEPGNNSGDESDSTSWNSYKEGDSGSPSSPTRKRKHSGDSVSQEKDSRSSESSKKNKYSSNTSGHLKVDSSRDYIPNQKKKQAQEHRDLVEQGRRSRHDHAAKTTVHVASSKQDNGKYSATSQLKRDLDCKDRTGKTKTSSNSHRVVNERGDSQIERMKVDRKQRRHSLSPSDDDDDHPEQTSGGSLNSSKNVKPVHSLDTHKYSSSSSSHKHSSSSSSHKDSSSSHKDSSGSHKHSTNSHKPQSSDSQMQSPSLNADSHPSTSSSRKHSSTSNSEKNSTSSSHRHSDSARLPSSGSHKQSTSSNSHKNSSDPLRHSSDSHKHSSSSHRQTSSSSSHKHSPDGEATSSRHHTPSASPSGQHTSVPEAVSSKPQSSRHTLDTSQNSSSSNSHRQSGSSRIRDNSAEHHKNSDHTSRSHDKMGNTPTTSKEKDSLRHHSSHSSSKKSIVSDTESHAKEFKDNSLTSLKEKSKHSTNQSHKDEGFSDKHSSSKKHSENQNLEKKSNSPSSKQNNSYLSSEPSDLKISSGNENEKLHSSLSENKSGESKSSPSKFTKIKPAPSHKKSKHKDSYQQPDLDLFSDAIHFKAEPPVPRSTSSKARDPKPTKPPASSSSKAADLSQEHPPSDAKAKAELAVNEHKSTSQSSNSLKEHKNTSPGSNSLKDDVRVNTDEDSDSQQEYKKYTSGKDKKRKKVESPVQNENMSFEDFMAFDEAVMVKKGRSSVKSPAKASSSSSSSKDNHSRQSKTTAGKSSSVIDLPSSSKTGFSVPAPPSNVVVTELDILSMLPETQANYRPLRYNHLYGEEEEREASPPLVDPDVIGTKTVSRTHVYSGRKHGITEVKSLYDLCMQVLIDNIDAIDYVGIIPYSILKPVLERCTAQQLYQLEDYNPHFLEDTDELWEILCQRDFRGCKPDEMEAWRELYMRKFEERELKYQKLKQSMSSSISKGQAGRKAQLAYVDTVAKPPREVLRKQKQFGTGCVVNTKNKPHMKGSSSGLRAYKPSTLVPAHNPMDDEPRMMKVLPPMMAKSIQMRKNMRR
ncbi:hypothetical protein BsWGS_24651 [Bradybaena similaris]